MSDYTVQCPYCDVAKANHRLPMHMLTEHRDELVAEPGIADALRGPCGTAYTLGGKTYYISFGTEAGRGTIFRSKTWAAKHVHERCNAECKRAHQAKAATLLTLAKNSGGYNAPAPLRVKRLAERIDALEEIAIAADDEVKAVTARVTAAEGAAAEAKQRELAVAAAVCLTKAKADEMAARIEALEEDTRQKEARIAALEAEVARQKEIAELEQRLATLRKT